MNQAPRYTLGGLRRGLRHFVAGKLVGGLLGLGTLALVAHALSVPEYAAYVTIMAGVEIGIALSTFGIDWVGIRFVPEYQVKAGSARLRVFLLKLYAARLASLLSMASLLLFLHMPESEAVPESVWRQVAVWYGLLLVADGMTRFVNGVAFDSLLLQGRAQVTWIVRGLLFAGSLLFLLNEGHSVDLVMLAKLEALAGSTALLVATLLLIHAVFIGPDAAAASDWAVPPRSVFTRLATHNYVSGVLALACSPALLLFVASRFFGAYLVAPLGFAFSLANQIRRYLPADMFIGLIRPIIIAEQAGALDFPKLNRRATLVFKLSLLALAPMLAFLGAFGPGAMALLSGGKYPEAAWMVLGLMVVMIPLSHRRILEMVVNTIGLPHLWTRAAMAMTLTLPVSAGLAALDVGPSALIGGLLVAEVVANALILRGCAGAGYVYSWDRRGLSRLALGVLLAAVALYPFGALAADSASILVAAAASLLLFLLVTMALKPFQADERALVNSVLPRRIFVW